jgi:hypothetical protein
MYKVSPSVALLCIQLERHFQAVCANGIPYPNPRLHIIETFNQKHAQFVSSLNLKCPHDHAQQLILSILKSYCTLRIHHHLDALRRKQNRKKKGKELSKCKKLNM